MSGNIILHRKFHLLVLANIHWKYFEPNFNPNHMSPLYRLRELAHGPTTHPRQRSMPKPPWLRQPSSPAEPSAQRKNRGPGLQTNTTRQFFTPKSRNDFGRIRAWTELSGRCYRYWSISHESTPPCRAAATCCSSDVAVLQFLHQVQNVSHCFLVPFLVGTSQNWMIWTE